MWLAKQMRTELTRLNNEVTAKKEAAEEAVNALPEGDVKKGFTVV